MSSSEDSSSESIKRDKKNKKKKHSKKDHDETDSDNEQNSLDKLVSSESQSNSESNDSSKSSSNSGSGSNSNSESNSDSNSDDNSDSNSNSESNSDSNSDDDFDSNSDDDSDSYSDDDSNSEAIEEDPYHDFDDIAVITINPKFKELKAGPYQYQLDDALKIADAHKRYPFAIEVGEPGMGKTQTGIANAVIEGLMPVVVCNPGAPEEDWRRAIVNNGYKDFLVISGDTLKTGKNKLYKKFLRRKDIEIERDEEEGSKRGRKAKKDAPPKKEAFFSVTSKMKDMIDGKVGAIRDKVRYNGILLIIDEGQNFKNDSVRNNAASAITYYLTQRVEETMNFAEGEKGKCMSRILITTATPFDKAENAINYLRLLGITKHSYLFKVDTRKGENANILTEGIDEIKTYFKNHGLENNFKAVLKSKGIHFPLSSPIPDQDARAQLGFSLYQVLIARTDEKNQLTFKLNPEASGFDMSNMKNSHRYELELAMTPEELKDYEIACDRLQNAKSQFADGFINFGDVVKIMIIWESTLLGAIARKALTVLNTVPNSKILIFTKYIHKPIPYFKKIFQLNKVKNPLYFAGGGAQQETIAKFQEPNNKYRIMVVSLAKGSASLNINDKHGGFDRYSFMVPSYELLKLTQAAGRTIRINNKSIARVYLCFGPVTKKEYEPRKLIDNIKKKSDVARITTLSKKKDGTEKGKGQYTFPDNYNKIRDGWYAEQSNYRPSPVEIDNIPVDMTKYEIPIFEKVMEELGLNKKKNDKKESKQEKKERKRREKKEKRREKKEKRREKDKESGTYVEITKKTNEFSIVKKNNSFILTIPYKF